MNYLDQIIDAEEREYLYIKKSLIEEAGNGLFTAIDIYKDEVVSLYKGEILSQKEARDRAAKNESDYFINMHDGTIMDSKNVDCFAKYANDPRGGVKSGFKANTQINLNEKDEVCLVALRNIKQHEEIYCNYGYRYWKNRI